MIIYLIFARQKGDKNGWHSVDLHEVYYERKLAQQDTNRRKR